VPSDGARDIPDLSLFAGNGLNYSFYVTCQMDANASGGGSSTSCDLNSPYTDFQGGSGTSASVQAFAGIMALVNQLYGRQGNANYVLYPMAAQSGASCNSSTAAVTNSSCIFYDVTVGNNSVICGGGTLNCSNTNTASGQYGIMVSGGSAAYPATTGYDLATGLGSVNVANLVNHWTSSFTTTTTTLSLSPTLPATLTTLVHGQPINFTVNVTSGSNTPAGDVSLIAQGGSLSNATGIGPFTLSGGSVSNSTTMLPGGAYNVTAHYAGNGTYAASDSTPGIQVTVGKESSQTKICLVTVDSNTGAATINNGSTPYGSPYVLRMDVMHSSDGNPCVSATTGLISYPCPTGALTVLPAPTDVNPPPGTVAGHYTLNSQGYAEDLAIQLSPGTYPFVASYAGDNSYTASTSPTVPITITQAPTTTTIPGLPASAVVGAAVPLTVAVQTQSNGSAPTGTIQLLHNGSPTGSAVTVYGSAGTSSVYATARAFPTPTQVAGGLTITAQYSGDSNYAGSISVAATIPVYDFSLSANPLLVTISAPGQAGNSTVTVAPEGGFTGPVTLSVGSGCPTGATCTFSSPSVNVSSVSAVTSTLTITTTAASGTLPVLQPRVPPRFRPPVRYLWLLAGALALALVLGSSAIRRCPVALLFATTLLVAGVWAACGGGSGGTPTPIPTPSVSLSPTSLTFNSQKEGTTSAAQPVTLTNTGTATLSIASVAMGGTNPVDFAQTNTCGSSVAAGANCTINATFTPTAAGSRSASVSVTDNAGGSPQTINLSGTGVLPPTPAGTYPIVVNAVSGVLSHSLTVNVTVQ
jgi:hypothetical protein